jgi:hypothetical protein
MAGWFGSASSGLHLFPFAATLGGLAQFLAGMWAYGARDGIATAMHGMWGPFWIGYGIIWAFLVLATITACGAIATLFENLALFAVLETLAGGCALAIVHYLTGGHGWETSACWVRQVSAMLEGAAGRVLLPLCTLTRKANTPSPSSTSSCSLSSVSPAHGAASRAADTHRDDYTRRRAEQGFARRRNPTGLRARSGGHG